MLSGMATQLRWDVPFCRDCSRFFATLESPPGIPNADATQLLQIMQMVMTVPRRLARETGGLFPALVRALRKLSAAQPQQVDSVQLCGMVAAAELSVGIDNERADDMLEALAAAAAAEPILSQLSAEQLLQICSSYVIPSVSGRLAWATQVVDAVGMVGIGGKSSAVRDSRTAALQQLADAFGKCNPQQHVTRGTLAMAEAVGTELQQRGQRAGGSEISISAMAKRGWLPHQSGNRDRDSHRGDNGNKRSWGESNRDTARDRNMNRDGRDSIRPRFDDDRSRVSGPAFTNSGSLLRDRGPPQQQQQL
eukprot:SAG22_NODE_5995_length_919_cov_0.901220_1_plen_306_part_11